jgi:hypothetical protein
MQLIRYLGLAAFSSLLALSCAGLSRAERVRLGIDAARTACEIYDSDLSIPREAEADEVCLALAGGPE